MFKKLFSGLKKTRESLVTGMRRLLGRGLLDADTIDSMEELLYTADLGPAASTLADAVREANKKGTLKNKEDVEPFVKQQLVTMMGEASAPLTIDAKPYVILVCGVNGSGKTTSIAKLAKLLQREGHSVMLAACDTFRAAAVEQLTIWAERLGIPIVKRETGSDPSGLAYDAADAAVREGLDVLVVDTAGRLHTQKNLMAELEKIRRVLGKRIPGAPHEVLLILDGTTGQNAIAQAKEFRQSVEVTALMVTKLDGTARGGAVVSIRQQLGLPVRFIGVGEQADDIERFSPDEFIDALFEQEP
ncbi:MAG: signal recognition particle-docking protein FtsY [Planctomycetes bacterium]|nr:signal recognition particle-docking protein FtsY [Planctomycetota bacterium]